MENQNSTTQGTPLPQLPGAVAVLVFGIVAISTFWTGIVGLVFAIIAMSKGGKLAKVFNAAPTGQYSPSSLSMIKVGKTLGIVALILSIIFIIYWIVFGLFLGALAHHSSYNF
jgi:hypothetical protein